MEIVIVMLEALGWKYKDKETAFMGIQNERIAKEF